MDTNLHLTTAVYSIIMLIIINIFVRFTRMNLKIYPNYVTRSVSNFQNKHDVPSDLMH